MYIRRVNLNVILMRTTFVLSFTLILFLLSCTKEKDTGIPTILKGHVSDTIRGINLAGYKIVLVKKTGESCANWECGDVFEDVATTYTNDSGNYSMEFSHHLEPGQAYYLEEQYYGFPYYPEYYSGDRGIIPGVVNTRDIYAWKPVELKVTMNVLNNNHPPLVAGAFYPINDKLFFNTERTTRSETRTVSLWTRPNSNISIDFWYCADGVACCDIHRKRIPFRTTLEDVTYLNYTIDCATF